MFIPNDDLMLPDADLDLVFLAANQIIYAGPVDDPWYSAHDFLGVASVRGSNPSESDALHVYWSDEPVTVLGCAKQYQVCSPRLPKERRCTPLDGRINLEANAKNVVQSEHEAFLLNFYLTSRILALPQLEDIITVLGSSSLASSYTLSGGLQAALPDNQWQLDVERWHSIYLSSMQGSAIDTAEGPSDPKLRNMMQKPRNKEEKDLCRVQV